MSEEQDELGEYETFDHTPLLVVAARAVVARWEKGDLAAAVRALGGALGGFENSGDCANSCPKCNKEDVLTFSEPTWDDGCPDFIEQVSRCIECQTSFKDVFVHQARVECDEKGNQL